MKDEQEEMKKNRKIQHKLYIYIYIILFKYEENETKRGGIEWGTKILKTKIKKNDCLCCLLLSIDGYAWY